MTDIVDRLRRRHGLTHDPDQLWDVISTLNKDADEAADEIERLRKIAQRWAAANAEMRKALEKICEPITADGSAETVSACQALHEIICEIAQEALARKP